LAAQAAPRLAIAHYNLAATLSRIGDACRVSGAEILGELKASIELDPARLERARVDTDFKYVSGMVGFQRLLGADLRSVEGLTALLPKTQWRPPTDCGSDSGCGVWMKFEPGGKLQRDDRSWKGNDAPKLIRRMGTWRVEQRSADAGAAQLLITLDVPQLGALSAIHETGQLLEDGRLLFDSQWWTDSPDGCS
jgi:hypothetical protein